MLWNEQQLRSLMAEVLKAYIYRNNSLMCLEVLASLWVLIAFKWPHLRASSLKKVKEIKYLLHK